MATHDPIVLLFVQEKADFAYRVHRHNALAQNAKPGSDHFYPQGKKWVEQKVV